MYVTSRGAPRTGLPFVLPVSFDKIDNNNNNNSIVKCLFQKLEELKTLISF